MMKNFSRLETSPGNPNLRGASVLEDGSVNFTVFSGYASGCILALFHKEGGKPLTEIRFPETCRFSDTFAMNVKGLDDPSGILYAYRMEGEHAPEKGLLFDSSKLLVDPYADIICGGRLCGISDEGAKPVSRMQHRIPEEELIIYELNVNNFTRHPSSGAKHPGTFSAVAEKIPHLKELGINCVELMPVCEFDSSRNTWGYDSINFFAPKESYAAPGADPRTEFREMVSAFHDAGIEVILDVVFNHSPEFNEEGPYISWRGLDNKSYYYTGPDGKYIDYSGCRNTLSCNSPEMQRVIRDSLRHWVRDYGVDGFRFDLASVLTRGEDGAPMDPSPIIKLISEDPLLSEARLIAEPWDAAGLYQLGQFPGWGRWSEWNGRFRDAIRRFSKSDEGILEEVKMRLAGSPDIYPDGAQRSINFITAHDGFTLMDLVSYDRKHNEANGEDGHDGTNCNFSWNSGCEGPSSDPGVNALRIRRIKNLITLLMVSRGVPMVLYGDETGRTQRGNNNPYCINDESVWVDWNPTPAGQEIFRFFKGMVAFRKAHKGLTDGSPIISWRSERPSEEWDNHNGLSAAMVVESSSEELFIAMNMHWEAHTFILPPGGRWRIAADTAGSAPYDISDSDDGPLYEGDSVAVAQRSILILTRNKEN